MDNHKAMLSLSKLLTAVSLVSQSLPESSLFDLQSLDDCEDTDEEPTKQNENSERG